MADMEDVGGITLPKAVFDGMWAMMDAASMCLKFQTRTRIVIEYDPQREKWHITFSQPTATLDSLQEGQPIH